MTSKVSKKTVKDIDLSKIDLAKHRFILKAGTKLSRVIIGDFNPRIPTGQENRYAKNPYDVSVEKYQSAFRQGQAVTCSTGNTCLSVELVTAYREILKKYGSLEGTVAYKITILKDISGIDLISLCLSEGVEPMPREEDDFWHSFYGSPIRAQALRCRSAQDPDGENIIIFPDNIPDYLNSGTFTTHSKEEIESAIKQINNK